MPFVHYPCDSIQAINMGCIDAPIPISYVDIPQKHTDVQESMGHTDV